MLRKLLPRSIYDVMAAIGCFAALATGTAYAANTVFSTDIVDGEVKSVDIANDSIHSGDILDNTINTFDVHSFLGVDVVDGTLTGADIQDNSVSFLDIGSEQVGSDEVVNDSLLQSDIRAGAITNDEVLNNTLIGADVNDNSLTGADINESTLSMPPTTTVTFAGISSSVPLTDTFTKVTGKTLPAGSYAIDATADYSAINAEELVRDTWCQLRNGNGFIGGAKDRRTFHTSDRVRVSLAMNGGAQVPAGGGEVSLWCLSQAGGGVVDYAQMMIVRIDGFF